MSQEFPAPKRPDQPEPSGPPGQPGVPGPSAVPWPAGTPVPGQHPGGQYPVPGQYPRPGQYPGPGQYPAQGQYPAGQYPGPGQFGPGYGGPGQYARPGFPSPPVATSTTGPKIMTYIGIGLMVVSVIAIIVGIASVTNAVSRVTGDPTASPYAIAYTTLPGELEFRGSSGEDYAILTNSTSDGEIDTDDIEVTGPDGDQVDLSLSGFSFDEDTNGSRSSSRAVTFTAPSDGIYTVTVTGASADVSGSIAAVNASELATIFGKTAIGVFLIIAAVMCGVLGLGLAIGGAVWWNVRRNNRARVGTTPWPAGPGPQGPQGPSGPPAYGQPSP